MRKAAGHDGDQRGADSDPVRECEQAEHHEEPDLRDPANPFDERAGRGAVRQLDVPQDQRADIHGGEPAGMDE